MAPFYDFPGQIKDEAISVAGNRTFQVIQLADSAGNIIDPSEAGEGGGGSGSIPTHDYISLGYTGTNLTSVVYKLGGASGTVVATLTLAYNGSNNLISVTRS
jgi:hypothetical protein